MFNKFFKFLRGYVIIKIYGKNAARFLNICLRRKINVWDTVPFDGGIKLAVTRDAFPRLRPVARKSRVRVRICEKRGLWHTIRLYRKRYVFLGMIILCIILCGISTQFIWLVEINGVENCDLNSIMETLDKMGVKSGALKRNLPDGMDMKRELINGSDGIAWAWVYIEGAKARVEVYEQIIPPQVVDKDTPSDIVAVCDGVIKNMIVKNGEDILKSGDAVRRGDVIVSGKVPTFKEGYPEEYIYVHSIADVEAYTTHKRSGDYKLYYETRVPTGKRKTHISFEVFGKVFSLPQREVKYEEYDRSESRHELNIPFFGYSGIALYTVTYTEVSVNREPLSEDVAVEFAKNDLEAKISKELTEGSELKDENIEYEKKDKDTINVTLEMDFIQNIAVEQPINAEEDKGEEIFDKQTDRSTAGD